MSGSNHPRASHSSPFASAAPHAEPVSHAASPDSSSRPGGGPYDSGTSQAVALVTAELASNAVTHGRLPGRDFRLTLLLLPGRGVVRIEVTDTRPGCLPRAPAAAPAVPDAPSGRGLLLVAAYAERWGCEVRDAHTKTVWAEVGRPG